MSDSDDSDLSYDPDEIDIHDMLKNDKYEVIEWAISLDYIKHLNTKDEYGRLPLYYACALNREDVVKLCLRKGALVNARDHDERTALHGAVEAKSLEICRILLHHEARANSKDLHCRTPLHDACQANLYEIADLLCINGADVLAEEMDHGYSPLHICAASGFTELAELLILRGANVVLTSPQYYGKSPLHLACLNGHAATARMLCGRGADVNALSGFLDKTPLHICAELGFSEVAECLIENGADINATGKFVYGYTPLQIAALKGRVQTMRVLIKAGADLNVGGKFAVSGTALHVAAEAGKMKAVACLLESGIDVDCQEEQCGNTALHYACRAGHSSIAMQLVLAEADLSIKNKAGQVALDLESNWLSKENLRLAGITSKKNKEERLKREAEEERIRLEEERIRIELGLQMAQLANEELRYKAERKLNFRKLITSICDVSGSFTALVEAAAEYPEQDINTILIEDVGCTALTRATYRGFDEVVFGLLQWPGINIDAQELDGNMASHFAAAAGNRYILEQLLILGAKTLVPNAQGHIPVSLAPTEFLKQIIRSPQYIVDREGYVRELRPKLENSPDGVGNNGISIAKYTPSLKSSTGGASSSLPAITAVGYVNKSSLSGRAKISLKVAATHDFSQSLDDAVVSSPNSNHPSPSHRSNSFISPADRQSPQKADTGFILDMDQYNLIDPSSLSSDAPSVRRVSDVISIGTTSSGIDKDTEDFARGKFGLVPTSFSGCRMDMFFVELQRQPTSLEEARLLEIQGANFPQQYNVPTSFDSTDDWHEVKDYLWLIGYPYKSGDSQDLPVQDKRSHLYKLACAMDQAQLLFTEEVERQFLPEAESSNNKKVDFEGALKFSNACSYFILSFINLFEPVGGWPSGAWDTMSRLETIYRARGISSDLLSVLKRIADLCPLNAGAMQNGSPNMRRSQINVELFRAPKELQMAPYRYRRIAVDAMYEVSSVLKSRAEAEFPIDSMRAHLWAHNGRKQLARMALGFSRTRPRALCASSSGVHNATKRWDGLALWLQELQLSEYIDDLSTAGFRMLEDFIGLTLEDCEHCFPFMKIGDIRRIARHAAKLTAYKAEGYEHMARSKDSLETVPVVPPPSGFLPSISSR